MHKVGNSVPPDREIFLIPGPVENKGLSFYGLQVHKFPEPAVITVVAVIAHNKKRIFRDRYRAKVITALHICRKNFAVPENGIFFILRFAIDVDLFVFDFDGVTLHADYPFDIVLVGIYRVFEDNNISSCRLLIGDPGIAADGVFYTVYEFVDENVVSDEQGVLHGAGGYFKGLDYKGPDKKRKQQRNENGFNILTDGGLALWIKFFCCQ